MEIVDWISDSQGGDPACLAQDFRSWLLGFTDSDRGWELLICGLAHGPAKLGRALPEAPRRGEENRKCLGDSHLKKKKKNENGSSSEP